MIAELGMEAWAIFFLLIGVAMFAFMIYFVGWILLLCIALIFGRKEDSERIKKPFWWTKKEEKNA